MKRALPLLLVAACALSSEESFTGRARLDACDGAVPVCSTTAGCRLSMGENYARVVVPGYRAFVVNTEGEADVLLRFYWLKQLSPGQDVEVVAWEPGCAEPHRVTTTGSEMFRQVGQDRTWTVTTTVYEGGDHLVELRMDAQGEFLLKVDLVTPRERGQATGNSSAPEPPLPGGFP